MKELDRLATTGKMIDQGIITPGMPMAPQGMAPQAMPMAPQGMAPQAMPMAPQGQGMKKGGVVKAKAKAKAKASSASKRADGCCVKGKTKGRMV